MGSQIKDNDFFDLKRELAEEKAVCAQLRETIAKTQGNPQRSSHFVTLSKEIKLLKLKLEQVVKDKSAEVCVGVCTDVCVQDVCMYVCMYVCMCVSCTQCRLMYHWRSVNGCTMRKPS